MRGISESVRAHEMAGTVTDTDPIDPARVESTRRDWVSANWVRENGRIRATSFARFTIETAGVPYVSAIADEGAGDTNLGTV